MSVRELTLDQLGEVARGRSRHRPRDAAHLYGGPFPFIQTGDVKRANLYLTEFEQTYSEAGLAQSKLWPAGTLCITIAANIADTAILGIDACFPDSVIGFTADAEKADTRFVKYLFDGVLKFKYRSFTQGAAQDNLSQEKLLSIKFPVPEHKIQRRIADILSAYDDLIENNRRRIALLEEAARMLYREWFVHFRFPGHEHVKIIDGLPEGWELFALSDLADFVNGYPFKPSELGEDGLPIVKIPELKSGVTDKTPRNSGEMIPERYHLNDGDLIFSWSGTLAVNIWASGPALLNQHLFLVLPTGRVSSAFMLFALREALTAFDNHTVGATMKHIRRSALDRVLVALPDRTKMSIVEDSLQLMYRQLIVLNQQSQKLAQARDLLLPRLMTGEIAV
ncbi:restriction endonuclease subunit S [Bradyrhizobium japonicum]|uniref:restriction endonuclease subunit S n=1 Tax=Bradyrhizobium japonicum TaxID=375 RepID=UPI0004B62847|nr:restriction endonuclease subunit S [Bradyrhizobium japonicum]